MEFVYLVAQNESLHERLTKQVQRLQDEVREEKISPNELELLRLVSVPSAYEARVDLKLLVEKLKLPAPERTLDLFEREYLIRRSKDGRYIKGCHTDSCPQPRETYDIGGPCNLNDVCQLGDWSSCTGGSTDWCDDDYSSCSYGQQDDCDPADYGCGCDHPDPPARDSCGIDWGDGNGD